MTQTMFNLGELKVEQYDYGVGLSWPCGCYKVVNEFGATMFLGSCTTHDAAVEPSFAVSADGSIVHRVCGRRSFNAEDVRHRYCGHCCEFLEPLRVRF